MRAGREVRIRPWLRAPGARPYVLGHRGARHAAPENTLLAFELARSEGADGVELDVRLDRDRRVIVLHDASLARVSGGVETRAAEALAPAELARVDVGRGERVPLLADVLSWAREGGMRVNVELKSDVGERRALLTGVARSVRASGLEHEQLLFSSFHPLFVRGLASLLSTYPHAWLFEARQKLLRATSFAGLLGASGVNPQSLLVNAGSMARWRALHYAVSTWTVNHEGEARRVAALGVDSIISDRPGAILKALSG